jgi:hypothetical protein
MLRSLPKQDWATIDSDVEGWFLGDKFELAGAHDFWNGFDGFSRGYKLKGLTTFITAENISWTLQDLAVEQLQIGAQLEMMAIVGDLPHSYSQVKAAMQNPKTKQQMEALAQKYLGGVDKDLQPIIVLKRGDKYQTHDGNARIARAFIYDRPTVAAWVGEFTTGYQPQNHWLSTGMLMDLVKIAKQNYEHNSEVYQATRLIIRHLISTLPIARINYRKRILRADDLSSELVIGLDLSDPQL